ncbi:MAG: Hpt domain-containing protein [Gammaproteobacteria bacterium]|nr:Hpt domain-containing protein [Gammaproteobacteria bacterium]MDH3856414.1 Hpt domain-containing protein [Gammaproteobacteria bacterium]
MDSAENSIKHSALGWVKKSIDDNLSDIKTDLKLYIEEDDSTLMSRIKERLDVIQGVLVMIEQYGAAMLTEEMVSLADFIIDNKQQKGEQALEIMLRAVLQLPDYLEHIQSGHRDIPIAILPILNDIRAVRDQDLFSEKLLFLPDLSMHQEEAEVESIDDDSNQASKLLVKKLRPAYQLALLNIIKDQSVEEGLKRLEKICETLEERSFSEQIARIWWIVGALIESVSRQQLELGVSIKNLLGKVDALFRVILIIGERGLLQRQPIELIKNFLFYVAQPECDGPKAKAIKTAYRLEQFLPSESVRSEVLSNIAGPNQALLKTVAEAVKADIEVVKSTLEVYVNGDLSKVEALKDLPQEMHVISDTLAMVGLGSQRKLIEAQIDVVKDILAGNQVADEERLLSMAAELLQVEQALEQMQKRQPVGAEQPRSEADASRDYELDSVLTAVVTATLDDIQKTKNAILDFIKDPSRSENIDLCVALMEESHGALALLNQQRAVAVIDGLLTYLKGYDIVEFMEASRLDALSQVVVSLEYYLEALGEHRSDAANILDFADVQLQELLSGVHIRAEGETSQELLVVIDEATDEEVIEEMPVPVADADETIASVQAAVESETPVTPGETIEPGPDSVDTGDSETAAEPIDVGAVLDQATGDSTVLTETGIEATVVPPDDRFEVQPVIDELDVLKPGSDPEILEIYLEEAEEEAQNIARLQRDWLLHPEDENAVKNIRRAFHTIKGSGRLVGAMKLGEFAWDYEQLLNRIIDKTIPPGKRSIEAVGKAAGALKEMVRELKTSESPTADIGYLRGLARALAEFKAEQVLIDHTQTDTAIESPYDRITDGDETELPGIDLGATTQVIPPDRLNDMILEQIEPDTMRVDPTNFEVDDEEVRDEGEEFLDFDEDSGLDDTQLVHKRTILDEINATKAAGGSESSDSSEDYLQATDYGSQIDDQTGSEADEIKALELDDVEPVSREAIRIEAIGEDFLGNDFDDELDGQVVGENRVPGEAAATDEGIDAAAAEYHEDENDQVDSESFAVETADEVPDIPEESVDASAGMEVIDLESSTAEEHAGHVPETEETAEDASVDGALEPAESKAGEVVEDSAGSKEEVAQGIAEPEEEPEQPALAEIENPETLEAEQETPHDPFVETKESRMPGEGAGTIEPENQEEPEPTDLSLDPELLIIYQQEVEQHLDTVSFALDHAEQIHELVPGEEIYRALHTINGASRTADIRTIGELAGLMEKPLKSAISQKMALDDEIVALYREGQLALSRMTQELVTSRQLPDISADLAISFKALAEDFEEHTVEIPEDEAEPARDFIDTLTMLGDDVHREQDHELLSIFVDEANELLEMSDNTLHQWSQQKADEQGTQDYNAVMELQRYLHTLKGGARMAELKEISDLSHEMESMFIAVIDGRVEKNDNLIELLKDCFDLLHQQVIEAQEGRETSKSERLVEFLRELRRGDADNGFDETDAEDNFDMDSEDIDIVSENLPGEPLSTLERPSQDVIKVRSDLLDNLVSSAGEVSIYRARMEQQIAGLGSHLGELGQTITRLKGQLRSLEAETDAQIHFSHRTESVKRGEFDPLEMDRYTMIQELSRSLSESVNDLSSLQAMLGEQVRDSETLLLQQSRVNTDLQDGLIKSRMVKFSGLLSRLRRLVRQSSQELGKKADLLITGEQNEVDNKVLDRMVAPLEHIIRNALSHGIETPVERVKKGKPETGKIAIDITRDGSDIVIRVSDDGAGVDIEKVRSRAVQLGLLDRKHQTSDADLVQYILEPGFSTAEHVTQLSGRGVGMDVVDIEIKQLGGTLQIETNPQGTTFIARLPFTLSINQAILVRTGEEIYAIPLMNIEGITRLEARQVLGYYREEKPELEYAGQQFALHSLSELVEGGVPFKPASEAEKLPIIFSRAGDVRAALHVDEILGNREIVVKSLGKQLSQVKGLAGASILADGSIVLILDINGLIRHSVSNAVKIVYQQQDESGTQKRNVVMVVDDSITMRRVASKLLERHNYEVVTAKDGVDALAQLQDLRPDVMLLDIEMPRMDGFELATHMQNEESFSRIPIIMITSRTGEKHRDRAFEIGVNNYMGKPYQEEELIENIQTALGAG